MEQNSRRRRAQRNQHAQSPASPYRQGYIPQQVNTQSDDYAAPDAEQPYRRTSNTRRRKKKLRPIAIVGIVILLLAVLSGLSESMSPQAPAYQIYDQAENYIRDGVQGVSYRVVIDPNATDKELLAAYSDLRANDAYSLHAVFFFSNADLIREGWGCDVGRITDETGSPVLDR